jgi:hypothetical protein
MIEKLFWFGAGFFVARYLILRDGVDSYKAKEAELISTGQQKIDSLTGKQNLVDDYDEFVDYTPYN